MPGTEAWHTSQPGGKEESAAGTEFHISPYLVGYIMQGTGLLVSQSATSQHENEPRALAVQNAHVLVL